MLKSPNKTKYKAPHLRLCNKGLKGCKRVSELRIKTKQGHLMSPQQERFVEEYYQNQ